jgi:hypothetical protein
MPGLSDGLGDRLLMFDNTAASTLELLRFKSELTDRPVFEAAVRQRMRELERFDHPGFARVRAFKSLGDREGLALVSNHTVGQRLSVVLQAARGPALGLDLIRQLTPVLASLQEQGADIAHGVLTPERIIVTPEGRLVMVEHVLGSALQSLNLPPHRRLDLGMVAHAHDGLLGRRGDVVQLGLAALSLVLGRRIDPVDYPLRVATMLDELERIDAPGASEFARLRRWMQHALQFGGRAFGSAAEAHEALRDVLEQRDAAPRENVIAFPPAPTEPVIDLTSADGRDDVDTARVIATMPELDLDVAALWQAAQAYAARSSTEEFRQPPSAADGDDDFYSEADIEPVAARQAPAASSGPRPGLIRRLAQSLSPDAASWQVPGLAPALAVLAFVQAILIALLLAVPPTPEQIVVTRTITPEAPAGANTPIETAADGSVAATPGVQLSYHTMPRRPPTFTENFVAGLREAPGALGRGVAAVWRAGVDLVKNVFSRARGSGSQ